MTTSRTLSPPPGPQLPPPGTSDRSSPAPGLLWTSNRPRAGTVVITVRGEVDMLTAPQLADIVTGHLDDVPEVLVLDLSRLDFLDAAGLSVLVRAHRRAGHGGTELRIATGDSRPVRRALTASGLDHHLPVRHTDSAERERGASG